MRKETAAVNEGAWKETGALLGKMLIIIAVVLFLFKVLLAFVFVNGDSMLNTYHDGDAVIAARVGYEIERGDVILFKDSKGIILIKRVIALPGDTIQIGPYSDLVFLNGEVLEEDYLGSPTYIAGIALEGVALRDGEYFVMGDNRMDSRDSRFESVGPVSESQMVGKVVVRLGNWTWMRDAIAWLRGIPSALFGKGTTA